MQQIKFRYGYTDGKKWMFKVFTLDEIESGHAASYSRVSNQIDLMKLTTRDRWTGRLDDNKQAIYENDIVIDILGLKYKVEWNDDTCKWQLSDGSDINDGDRYSSYLNVIGNIHEKK